MKIQSFLANAFICAFASTVLGNSKIIFEDRFDRNESQEKTDEVGNGWSTNSESRAGGHKQVDLKDGAMRIYMHETADHGVSVTHPAEFRDGTVKLRFMLENEKDSFGLNFADREYKEVHAGHICMITVSTKEVKIRDLKTGVMNLETRKLRLAKKLTEAQQEELKTKESKVSHRIQTGTWYDLVTKIDGDEMSITIDGKLIHSFRSSGIAHPTKRTLRIAVPSAVVIDDLQIFKSYGSQYPIISTP